MLIPTKLRTIVAKTLSHGIGLNLAKEVYWKVTNLIAKKFLSIDGIENVLLRGGMLTKITPGFSDIDITLISSNTLSLDREICLWEKVKRTFNILKKVFPIIGEVQLFREDEWNLYKKTSSEDMFIFNSQREYHEKEWRRNPIYEKVWKPSLFVRFLKAFSYYREAISFSNSPSHYNNYLIKKSLLKSLECLEKCSLNKIDLETVFFYLDSLASDALNEPINQKIPNRDISNITDEKYVINLVMSEVTLQKLSSKTAYNLYLTKLPFYYVLDVSSVEELSSFWTDYKNKVTKKTNPKPIFISQNMYRVLLRTWSTWWPNAELNFPFFPILSNKNDSRFLYISLLNRITNNMIGIFSTYLTRNENDISMGLKRILIEIMNLISPKFSRSRTELVDSCMKVNAGLTNTIISLLDTTNLSLVTKILCLRKLITNVINLN